MLGRKSRLGRKPDAKALEVVIAGGGVAALETALALRKLAGDRVKLTLLAPTADFVYLPTAVLEPFIRKPPRHLRLATVAAELNATLEQDTIAAVDCERRVLHTGVQRELPYDALVIAVGATTSDVLPDAIAIDISRMDDSLHGLIEEIDRGSLHSLAFVALRSRRGRCPSTSWRFSSRSALARRTSISRSRSSPQSRGRWQCSARASAPA